MAFWMNHLVRTLLTFEDYIVAQILRSPAFHHAVRRIHRRVQDRKHGRDPNEPLQPGEATKSPLPDGNRSFMKYFIEELKNQFRGRPSNPPPPRAPPQNPR